MDSATNLLERHSSTGDLSSGPAEVEVTTRARATFGMDAAGNSTAEGVATTTATLRSAGSDEDIFEQVQMILRKRRGWGPEDSLNPNDLDLLEYDDELGEEDDAGCPLPSTPEDTQLIEAEVSWGYQPPVPPGGSLSYLSLYLSVCICICIFCCDLNVVNVPQAKAASFACLFCKIAPRRQRYFWCYVATCLHRKQFLLL